MFDRYTLGRPIHESFDNGWRVCRIDMRRNSAAREWMSVFSTKGKGSSSIEINLDEYNENRWICVTVGIQNAVDRARFIAALEKHNYKVHYSASFPKKFSLEGISRGLASKTISQLIDIINEVNREVNPEDPTILPKNTLVTEVRFVASYVAFSAEEIRRGPNWFHPHL